MEDQIPERLVTHSSPSLQREKIHKHRWPVNACVARPVTKKELFSTHAALKARDKEWGVCLKKMFDMANVQEWSKVAARARSRGKTVHVGIVFGFCVKRTRS